MPLRPSVVASLGLATATLLATGPALAANNVPAQVTDAVTQTNVKILGDAPAMAIGTIYESMAHSVGLGLNQSPGLVQHATTLGESQLYAITTAAEGTPVPRAASTKKSAYRKIDAIAQHLDECAESCVLNMQVHLQPLDSVDPSSDFAEQVQCDVGPGDIDLADLAPDNARSAADLIATCVAARMVLDLGHGFDGIATYIPDGDTGALRATSLGTTSTEVPWRDARVTSIDLFVQRIDGDCVADVCDFRP